MSEVITTPTADTVPAPSFLEQIEAARKAPAAPVEAPPAPSPVIEAPPVVEVKPAPKAEPAKKEEPKTPLEEIESEKEEPEFKLPIDEDEQEETAPASEEAPEGEADNTPAGKRFAALKKELKESQRLIAERDSKLAQYESKVKEGEGATSELETLRQKLAEYETERSVIKLEQTDAYKQAVAAPLAEIFASSDKIAERYKIDPDKLADVIGIADEDQRESAFTELTSGLEVTPADQYKMRALSDKLLPVLDKRKGLYENADQALAELTVKREQETAAEAAASAEERRKTTSVVSQRVVAKLGFVKELPGVDYEAITEKVGKTDFDKLPVHDKAYAHLAGELLPKVAKDLAAKQNQIDALLDELEGYKKASPNPGGGKPVPANGKEPTLLEKLSAAR